MEAAASRATTGAEAIVRRATEATAKVQELFGFAMLFGSRRLFKGVHGTLNPSLWRWYHRHGYWATRRKMLDFATKRKYRYDQVEGLGRRHPSYFAKFADWWCDKSYF